MKIFMKSGSDIIGALKQLLVAANENSERQMTMLASFVCDAYCPNGIAIRRMFCKQMAEINRLPSTSEPSNSTFYAYMSKLEYATI